MVDIIDDMDDIDVDMEENDKVAEDAEESTGESMSVAAAPQYIQVLVDMIRELSNKIDNLEHKVDLIRAGGGVGGNHRRVSGSVMVPDFEPAIGFQQWIQGFEIGKEDVMVLLGTNVLDGFKCCLTKHMGYDIVWEDGTLGEKPIWIGGGSGGGKLKPIYLYDITDFVTNTAQWRIMTDNDICVLIEMIWRKMVQYYFIDEEETLEGLSEDELTARDSNKKKLLDTKKKLYRHVREIQRCIIGCFVE